MRALVIASSLVACSAPPAKSVEKPAPAAEPKRDLAVAEPAPKEPVPPEREGDPRDPSWRHEWIMRQQEQRRPDLVIHRRAPRQPQELDISESETWSPCVRDFVRAQSDSARRALAAAFARYEVRCDANKRVLVEPPPELFGKPFLAYSGKFTLDRIYELHVEIATCGNPTSIHGIGFSYDSKRLSALAVSERRDGCTIAIVPDTPAVRRALRAIVDAKEAIVNFGSAAEDFPITDEMKRDVRLMLDALDALTAP